MQSGDLGTIFRDMKGLGKLWPYLRAQKAFVIVGALLIPVISALQTTLPLTVQRIIDQGITGDNLGFIADWSLIYLGLVVAEYLARAIQNLVTSFGVHRMVRDMRDALIAHVLKLSARFHDKSMSGALVTRATSDFDNLSESLNQGVLTSIVDLAVLAGGVTGLFILNEKLAFAAILVFPLVGTIVTKFSGAMKRAMLAARKKIAQLNAFTQECLYGVSTVKLLGAETAASRHYQNLSLEYRDTQMRSVLFDAVMFSILDGISSITIGIVLWLAVSKVGLVESLSAGVMVAFVQYIQVIFEPIKQLSNKIAMLQGAFTSIDRIFGIFETKDFVPGDQPAPENCRGEVAFRDVHFSYGLEDEPILRGVSFHIDAGKSFAIVGPTGSGKSTLIKLISKLYSGYEGSITLDGVELAGLDPQSLRQKIAIVPQDIALFEGSLRFNIGLNRPEITDQQILQVIEQVGLSSHLTNWEGGLDFQIRESGNNLSVGQRQLVAFARALVKRPALIILDEATSSVDPESEELISRATETILKTCTTIVIAHRLSTIEKCDEIIVMGRGKILERGTHRDLMNRGGAYTNLAHGSRGLPKPAQVVAKPDLPTIKID